MKVTKTIQGGIVNLTRIKRDLLDREYENLQRYLHGEEDVDLYSANRQQADRYYATIKEDKEYLSPSGKTSSMSNRATRTCATTS